MNHSPVDRRYLAKSLLPSPLKSAMSRGSADVPPTPPVAVDVLARNGRLASSGRPDER
jgi:hypothetical protein